MFNGEEICGGFAYYDADEVDAAIEELKDKIQQKDFFWEGCGFAKMGLKNTIAVYEYLDDLNAENRKLKRALWLSRALRARDKAFEYHFKNNVEMCAKWDNVHLMLMAKAEEYK
jgi:hypothetical protein